jgi:hypothetical protein
MFTLILIASLNILECFFWAFFYEYVIYVWCVLKKYG